jgi:hypothetical protein
MFRFTIRDVLWLTVVVAQACGWALEHRQLTVVRGALHSEQAEQRIAELRERELRGGVILTPAPAGLRMLQRRDDKLPRAKDD